MNSNNSNGALAILLANHRRFLSFLEARVGSRQDAEEILQEAFVRTLSVGDSTLDAENVVAWFYRVLRNAVVDHFRRRASRNRAFESFAEQLSPDDSDADPAAKRMICECVQDLIQMLKPEYADMIRRVDLEGLDVAAAGQAMGIASGNARVRLHRARAALRKEVERTCRTCATHGCLDCNCQEKRQPE